MRAWWETSGKPVYILSGLRLEGSAATRSPCDKKRVSRWHVSAGVCPNETPLDDATLSLIAAALGTAAAGAAGSAFVHDVVLVADTQAEGSCTTLVDGVSAIGASVSVNGSCYTHVHPQLFDVVDASYWSLPNTHPGTKTRHGYGEPNPIVQFAIDGEATLDYPAHHPMSYWEDQGDNLQVLGRLGETVQLDSLPPSVRSPAWVESLLGADAVASAAAASASAAAATCGSPGEVANDPQEELPPPPLFPLTRPAPLLTIT